MKLFQLFYKGLTWFIYILMLFGCSKVDDPYASVYERYTETEIVHLDIEDGKKKALYPDEYTLISYTEAENSGAGFVFIVDKKDSLLAVSSDLKTIKSIDINTGRIMNEFRFEGRGPGEYQMITGFFEDSSNLILLDGSSIKVIRYSSEWMFIDEHSISGLRPLENIDYRHPWLIYSSGQDPDFLLSIRNLDNPDEDERRFHQRVIPLGKQPSGYNSMLFSISSDSNVAVLGRNMPILFLYKNFANSNLSKPDNIYRLHHEELNMVGEPMPINTRIAGNILENPAPVEIDRSDVIIGLTPIFQNITYDKGWLFIQQTPDNRLLILRDDGHGFDHHGSYQFVMDDGEPFQWTNATFSYPWLYLSSSLKREIIRVDVNSLSDR